MQLPGASFEHSTTTHQCQDTETALQAYSTIIDKGARDMFLSKFETHWGAGKGQHALKWVSQFQKSLSHSSATEVASVEDMLTRPKILEHFGSEDVYICGTRFRGGSMSWKTSVCSCVFAAGCKFVHA